MATMITDECINCGACVPKCPNKAIYTNGSPYELNGTKHPALSRDYHYIVPEKCTECVGHYGEEQCAVACPADCCVPDPNHVESEAQLLERARALHPKREFPALSADISHFRQ